MNEIYVRIAVGTLGIALIVLIAAIAKLIGLLQ